VDSAGAIPGNVRRLQPLRVVVIGNDRRFIRVTAFLLGLRGYEVTEAGPGEALVVADRHRADVVLLECGASRASAARHIAQFTSLASAPAVVVVNDDGETLWSGQTSVKKWLPLDMLVQVIEDVSLQRELPAAHAG
jgi:CheY-like chemotaxis protein